jgi:translation initiation factor IF-1
MPEGQGRGSEARPEPLEVNGRVLESLPNALFKVELETETRQTITAHVAGSSSLLRILPGEAVVVELMAYDPRRGRIVRRRS